MLSHLHPPSLHLPRFDHTHDVPDPQTVPRSSATLFQEINRLVADSVSPLSRSSSGTVEDDTPGSPSGPNYHYAPRASRSPSDTASSTVGQPVGAYVPPYTYTSGRGSFRSAPSPDASSMPLSAPSGQDRFQIPAYSSSCADSLGDRPTRHGTLPKLSTSNIFDRRLSEPTANYVSSTERMQSQYSYPASPHSPQSPFSRHNYASPAPHPEWKQEPVEHNLNLSSFPTSFASGYANSPPLQFAFRGGADTAAGEDTYGPSPPGTGTSSSSNAAMPAALPGERSPQQHSVDDPTSSKTYSFVALPGNAVRKRPRRRYDEIERLYQCSWPECTKAYGTLNHLNAHVQMQKHGPKRSPGEFKELRKLWRKTKKEAEASSMAGAGALRRSMSMGFGMGLRREDLYQSPSYMHGPPHHHRSFSHHSASGLSPPLSASLPHHAYGVDAHTSTHPLRYSPDAHAHTAQAYGGADFRPAASGPWTSSSRLDLYQGQQHSPSSAYGYIDSGGSGSATEMYNHSASTPRARLPSNSMLLTPLVGPAHAHGTETYAAVADSYYAKRREGSGDEY